jgi:hypothetical protein
MLVYVDSYKRCDNGIMTCLLLYFKIVEIMLPRPHEHVYMGMLDGLVLNVFVKGRSIFVKITFVRMEWRI